MLVPSDITDVCKCVHCEANGEKAVIKEAICPCSVIPGSVATAEAIAQIATEKVVQATPSLPTGEILGTLRSEAIPPDHVQLALACC